MIKDNEGKKINLTKMKMIIKATIQLRKESEFQIQFHVFFNLDKILFVVIGDNREMGF